VYKQRKKRTLNFTRAKTVCHKSESEILRNSQATVPSSVSAPLMAPLFFSFVSDKNQGWQM
jgi:hypothetical protein